jgi:hypothetical protein
MPRTDSRPKLHPLGLPNETIYGSGLLEAINGRATVFIEWRTGQWTPNGKDGWLCYMHKGDGTTAVAVVVPDLFIAKMVALDHLNTFGGNDGDHH